MARTTLIERTIERYRGRDSECWIYLGHKTPPHGYGQGWHKGRRACAHRAVYEIIVGPIPQGLELDHLCRNPPCCNPAHLETVTRRENQMRGNTVGARNARVTHCPKGHAYDSENTKISKRGTRYCATCNRVKVRARYHSTLHTRADYWTHCKRGHPKEPGYRGCRVCGNEQHREYKREQRKNAKALQNPAARSV